MYKNKTCTISLERTCYSSMITVSKAYCVAGGVHSKKVMKIYSPVIERASNSIVELSDSVDSAFVTVVYRISSIRCNGYYFFHLFCWEAGR